MDNLLAYLFARISRILVGLLWITQMFYSTSFHKCIIQCSFLNNRNLENYTPTVIFHSADFMKFHLSIEILNSGDRCCPWCHEFPIIINISKQTPTFGPTTTQLAAFILHMISVPWLWQFGFTPCTCRLITLL